MTAVDLPALGEAKFFADPEDAEVVIFNKGGREVRLDLLKRGVATPREFFYGCLALKEAGIGAAMVPSSGRVAGSLGASAALLENAFAAITAVGMRPISALFRLRLFPRAKAVLSFTDGFSLSLGLLAGTHFRPSRIGGFQGLSDIEDRSRPVLRTLSRALIKRAVRHLDHIFFFSPADRLEACRRYGIPLANTSLFRFGVDTEFWRPQPPFAREDFVLAVGQDPNRDFACLVQAPGTHPIRMVTKQRVAIPPGANHIAIIDGNFSGGGAISDDDLRGLYCKAAAVVVPLKDVYQPTGQSVTMQAMSCGCPVIISRIKGLWAPELLQDEENCLLVPPGDAFALGEAIGRLCSDRKLATAMGRAARETAVKHFDLTAMDADALALVRLGLSLAEAKNRVGK